MERENTPTNTPAAKRQSPRPKQEIPGDLAKLGVYWHAWGGFTKKWHGRHVYYGHDLNTARSKLAKDISTNGPQTRSGRSQTIGTACKMFMDIQEQRYESGEISDVQYYKYDRECRRFKEVAGSNTKLSRLCGDQGPTIFRRLREAALKRGLVIGELHIAYVRKLLDLAQKRGLMPMRNEGEQFEPPRPELVARARIAEEQKYGERAWSVAELRLIVASAWGKSARMRAAVLLALNCGFGADDCSLLDWKMIDREHNLIRAYRGKTLRKRVCPLWDVTIWALDQIRFSGPPITPKREEWADRVFLTRNGMTAVHKRPRAASDAGVPRTDAIGLTFVRLLRALGLKRHKTGFYTLRAMFRSAAVGCGVDHDLIAVIKGQKFQRAVDEYYLRADLRSELFKVVAHAFDHFFAGWSEPWPRQNPDQIKSSS